MSKNPLKCKLKEDTEEKKNKAWKGLGLYYAIISNKIEDFEEIL